MKWSMIGLFFTMSFSYRNECVIVECVALLMFVQGEIKEARLQVDGMAQCLRGKRTAERQYSETVSYKCYKGKAELEDNIDGSKSIKKLIIE